MSLGFFSWLLAAHLLARADVGLAGGTIAAMMLCAQIALLGIGSAVIAEFPRADSPQALSTALAIVAGRLDRGGGAVPARRARRVRAARHGRLGPRARPALRRDGAVRHDQPVPRPRLDRAAARRPRARPRRRHGRPDPRSSSSRCRSSSASATARRDLHRLDRWRRLSPCAPRPRAAAAHRRPATARAPAPPGSPAGSSTSAPELPPDARRAGAGALVPILIIESLGARRRTPTGTRPG